MVAGTLTTLSIGVGENVGLVTVGVNDGAWTGSALAGVPKAH